MRDTNKWTYTASFDEYFDFDKELFDLPDEGNTSIDMRLTFNTETRTAYYTISLHNDDGKTLDWEKAHYIPWAVGIAMLEKDAVEVPEALK